MSAAATVQAEPGDGGSPALRTIDELAAAAGLTVRTTRYYASLGLLPPPARRDRMAWYDERHLARLEMIRALQDHGFTLQAIERYLASVPADAGVDELTVQRAMLTSWTVGGPTNLSVRQLEKHAGRRLGPQELGVMEDLGIVRRSEDERGRVRYTPVQGFDVAIALFDLDIPFRGMRAAGEAIVRHMQALAVELTDVLHTEVIEPWRQDHPGSSGQAAHLEATLADLRRLTLEAIVSAFQRSANDVIAQSLQRPEKSEMSERSGEA